MKNLNEEKIGAIKFIAENWGDAGISVIITAAKEAKHISMDKYLQEYCVACGGDWCGLLLSGMKSLFPKTWEAIPNDMGVFAFSLICNTLLLCDVYDDEDYE